MKKLASVIAASSLLLAGSVVAQDGRIWDLPKFTASPTLDGNNSGDEWAGSLQLECSVSQILSDGEEFGWRDIENQASEVSVNQLNQSEGEDASIARTDDDVSSQIWQAWDDVGFYYLLQVRDNVHDVEGGGDAGAWWERDSMSLYVDLINTKEEAVCCEGPYTAMNIINFQGRPQNSSPISVTWERTIQSTRNSTNDPDLIDGFEYGYRDAEDEFGGEADYVIEGLMPWEVLQRFNLPDDPTVGTEMGFSWLLLDPDGDDGYGGQIQCYGWADDPSNYSTWVFSDAPAGPAGGTAVEDDSWGRIKATFK